MKNRFIQKAQELVMMGDKSIKKFGTKQFHQEAANLLSNATMNKHFDYSELVRSVFAKNFRMIQNFKHMEFSDLPLTIARGKDCFIDLYFWRRVPTTIHNHHFVGAFQSIQGHNVDLEFTFKSSKKITKFHSLGDLKLKRTRIIGPGDIETINFQDKFIHQNHHQADLCINLCFRTPDFSGKNLSNFLFSGFKYENDQESIVRAQRLLAFTRIDDFKLEELKLTLNDTLTFLLLFHASAIAHPRFLKLKNLLLIKVKLETGLDLELLLKKHECELGKIESEYE